MRTFVWLKKNYLQNHAREAMAANAGCRVVVEFHFNDLGLHPRGGEVGYKPNDALSLSLANAVAAVFTQVGIPLLQGGTYAATANTRSGWLPHYGCSAIILEPLSISNINYAHWIHHSANLQSLGQGIAAALAHATKATDIIGLSIGHRFKGAQGQDTSDTVFLSPDFSVRLLN